MASLEDLMKAKEASNPEDQDKDAAKMEVLKQLRKMAMDLMSEDMDQSMDGQSVTVSASDEEGLKEGLEVAEDVVEKGPEAMMAEEAPEGEMVADAMAEEEAEYEDEDDMMAEDPSDIDRQIAELEEKKRQLMMRS